jgi:hypothetical protein
MSYDPETRNALRDHQHWLGYAQPVGLVVSPPALLEAQAYLNRNILPEHRRFLEWVREVPLPDGTTAAAVTDWPGLLVDVFGWSPGDLLGAPGAEPVPETLTVALPEYNDRLQPTYAVREFNPPPGGDEWLLLMQVWPVGTRLDKPAPVPETAWPASPQARLERLLRETQIPIGLLCNATELRLVYAPRGESSGYLAFPVAAMLETDFHSVCRGSGVDCHRSGVCQSLCGQRPVGAPAGRCRPVSRYAGFALWGLGAIAGAVPADSQRGAPKRKKPRECELNSG